VRHVFGKVPIFADAFPSSAVEAYESSFGVCPEGAFVVVHDGCGLRRYTVNFAVALDVAVPQVTNLVPVESDPQTPIGERQQAMHAVPWKMVS
jgi:hypothetical protein